MWWPLLSEFLIRNLWWNNGNKTILMKMSEASTFGTNDNITKMNRNASWRKKKRIETFHRESTMAWTHSIYEIERQNPTRFEQTAEHQENLPFASVVYMRFVEFLRYFGKAYGTADTENDEQTMLDKFSIELISERLNFRFGLCPLDCVDVTQNTGKR